MRSFRTAAALLALAFPLLAQEPNTDPKQGEVPLPAAEGWNAFLVLDNQGTGVWTVESFQVFPHLACPEIVGLDDQGRVQVMVSYSGKWTPYPAIYDVSWLGGLAHADVDPRFSGAELYTGGARGNLYQVLAYKQSALDHRLIAHLPGCEIHTIVAGDLDPRSEGSELLVFVRPGALFRCTPTGPHGTWVTEKLEDLPGRVRHAKLLPGTGGEIACVDRAGRLSLLRITDRGPQWTTIYETAMGMGRVALKPGDPNVLYSCTDEGRILRHERQPDDGWKTETICHGPQGPRGIAAGRFYDDPKLESVAIFGYAGQVDLLTRADEGWHAETIFHDTAGGHWLAVAEVDGRNATDELVACGYSARVVLLARPPGYGRSELAWKKRPVPPPSTEPTQPEKPIFEEPEAAQPEPAAKKK